MEDLF